MASLTLARQYAERLAVPRRRDLLIVLAAAAAQVLYVALARSNTGAFGYPLDDSWIYQTYARNLAQTGQWAFIPGVPSTGSTSILWTLVLALGYLLPVSAYLWTQLAGFGALVAAALGAARLLPEDRPVVSLAAGLAVALEWHLVWAASSGMETPLFAALVIWFWVWLRRHDPAARGHRWQDGLLTGVWGGMLMLTRPEGVLAFGVAGLYGLLASGSLIASGSLRARLRWSVAAGVGFALLLGPFMAFNHAVSGSVWPNTFYAKQTEYSVLYARPYLLRFLDQATVMFVGLPLVLIPGIVAEIWHRVRLRTDLVGLAPLAWVVLHWAAYAARLPVVYQHGRYAIPVVAVLVAYGVHGLARLVRPRHHRLLVRAGSQAWLLVAALLAVLMTATIGGPAYAENVQWIERDIVAAARWIGENTAPDEVIAAHDIGALGYFAPRPLLDLAGLVSPEIIPYMSDVALLADYVEESDAGYLVCFPAWSRTYEALVATLPVEPVWSADEQAGYGEPSHLGAMTIYRIQR